MGEAVGAGVGAISVGHEPGPEGLQPGEATVPITAAAQQALQGGLTGVAMGQAMAAAEAPPVVQPALLEPQVQLQIPQQDL